MPRRKKIIGAAVLGIVLVASGFYFFARNAESTAEEQRRFFVGRLPALIQQVEVIPFGQRSHGFRGGCGAAIFSLSRDTHIALAERGLKYLETALHSRDDGHSEMMNTYEAWAKTPLPRESKGDRGWQGLECLPFTDHGNDLLVQIIYNAGYEDGSYFTSNHGEVTLVIIPKLNVVVYAFYDS